MNYYGILNLTKEPFSNSPDPDFFFQSREHLECLQKLELSLHLRRGLNVVIGDVGTGKTTLCRQLIRRFTQRSDIETHLILDPSFPDPTEFLKAVAQIISGQTVPEGKTDSQIKELIKNSLFQKGVDQDKTMILIIDEGQTIPPFCLELLREFLNYETNEFKLLQIVIFAQTEFEGSVKKYPNFADRINLYHILKPLSFRDTRLMINYRLEKSSQSPHRAPLFTYPALVAIYRATAGYPRKIINLCHQAILAMIIQNRRKVGYFLIRKCAHRVFQSPKRHWMRWAAASAALAVAAIVILSVVAPDRARSLLPGKWRHMIARSEQTPQPKVPIQNNSPKTATEASAAAKLKPADLNIHSPAETEEKPTLSPDTPVEAPNVTQTETKTKAEASPSAQERVTPMVVAANTPPPEPEESVPTEAASLPPNLGILAIEKNETLSGLIHNIYGVYNSRYFNSLVLANTSIDDPDQIPVGMLITIPAVPLDLESPTGDIFWVKLAESDRLQPIYNRLRSHPQSAPAVRLISYWTPTKGTRFALVLRQTYSDRQVAGLQVKLLPSSLAKRGQVIRSWGKEVVFFSDPYTQKYRTN